VDPTGPRAYHGTAVVGYNIYVIGGFNGMDFFNSCRCFNAVTKIWREVAPMNARRFIKAAAVALVLFALTATPRLIPGYRSIRAAFFSPRPRKHNIRIISVSSSSCSSDE
jgi:hypothetical protein